MPSKKTKFLSLVICLFATSLAIQSTEKSAVATSSKCKFAPTAEQPVYGKKGVWVNYSAWPQPYIRSDFQPGNIAEVKWRDSSGADVEAPRKFNSAIYEWSIGLNALEYYPNPPTRSNLIKPRPMASSKNVNAPAILIPVSRGNPPKQAIDDTKNPILDAELPIQVSVEISLGKTLVLRLIPQIGLIPMSGGNIGVFLHPGSTSSGKTYGYKSGELTQMLSDSQITEIQVSKDPQGICTNTVETIKFWNESPKSPRANNLNRVVPNCFSCRRPLLGNFFIDDRDWGATPIDTNSRLNLRLISKTGIVRTIQISAPISDEDSTTITRVNTGVINGKNYLDLIVPFANIDGRYSGVRFVLYRLGRSPKSKEDAANDGIWAGYSLKTVSGETSAQGIDGSGDVVRQVVATGEVLENTYILKDRLWDYKPDGGKEFAYKTRLMPVTSMSLWPKAKIGSFLHTQEEYPSVWRVWACASLITFSQYLRIAGNVIADVINVTGEPSKRKLIPIVQQASVTVQWFNDDDEVFEIMRDDWMRSVQNLLDKLIDIEWSHNQKVFLDTVLSLSLKFFGKGAKAIFKDERSPFFADLAKIFVTDVTVYDPKSSNMVKTKTIVKYVYLFLEAAVASGRINTQPIPLNAALVNDAIGMLDLFANKTDEFIDYCKNRRSVEGDAPATSVPETPLTGEPSSQPVKPVVETPPSSSTVRSLHVGSGSTCAIYVFGNVKCWGDNVYGQLGDGTYTNRDTPVAVNGLGGSVRSLAKSYSSTCALLEIGAVECWGYNGDGQLGDGTTTDRLTPIRISSLGTAVMAISGSFRHFCALLNTGAVKCWGLNIYGELGNGSNRNSSLPVQVDGLTSGVTSINVGSEHSCAVLVGGSVKCWGYGRLGQLGNGSTGNSSTPVQVAGLTSGVVSVSAGTDHSCALKQNGSVVCWGGNRFGQLGDGTQSSNCNFCAVPSPVAVSALTSGVSMISVGDYFSCAVLIGGSVKCWGSEDWGRLGNGVAVGSSPTPELLPDLASGVTSISTAGDSMHTCVGLTPGAFKCWGRNYAAEAGLGSRSEFLSQPLFVRVL